MTTYKNGSEWCKLKQVYDAAAFFLVCSIIILISELLWNKQGKVHLRRVLVLEPSRLSKHCSPACQPLVWVIGYNILYLEKSTNPTKILFGSIRTKIVSRTNSIWLPAHMGLISFSEKKRPSYNIIKMVFIYWLKMKISSNRLLLPGVGFCMKRIK